MQNDVNGAHCTRAGHAHWSWIGIGEIYRRHEDWIGIGETYRLHEGWDGGTTGAHPDFKLYVTSVDHRAQCLFHSLLINTLYIIGKPGAIIRVVILYFGSIITKWYSDVIIYQHKLYLSCVHTVDAVPEEWDDIDFGWAGTGKILKRHIALRRRLREMRLKYGVQPSPKHILPTIIVDRNMYKGGADQKTREHANISGLWEKHLTPTQRMVVHALKHTFGQPFHLFRHAQLYNAVQRGKMGSYGQVRNALSKVILHRAFIAMSL